MLTDTFVDQGRRQRMCEALRQRGITDQKVLDAMGKIPRHWFFDVTMSPYAYEDRAIPITCGQTISRPSTVAMQSQLLNVQRNMKVLEIGTGSGYQTAVLCTLGARVYTIERQKGLFDATRRFLSDQRYTAKCFLGDGFMGLQEVDYGPYDRIIITCGAPYIPKEVMRQLKMGGLLVIPVGEEQQQMLRVTKNGDEPDQWVIERFGDCKFVPMLEGRQF